MARGNLIQGQGSGKLGSTVLMVRNGQQLSRVYTTAGARSGDQASESARIQRVKFGSAANQWGLYKYVSTRMYRKGRNSSQSDYNYFVKRNNQLLPYFTKAENADGVHVLMPGTFSEGNLGRIELVHNYRPTAAAGQNVLVVADTQAPPLTQVNWSQNMSAVKSSLKAAYPSASKVTYLISLANELTLQETGVSFVSQMVQHYPVAIDLYNEVSQGENQQTAAAYFAAHIKDGSLSTLIASLTSYFIGSKSVFCAITTVEEQIALLGRVSILLFATNDNVSDCYTTILPESGANPTAGVYNLWASYRTEESLRVASDSYGYQQGTMRDYVAAYGNELNQQAVAYAAKLRQVDASAADEYIKELEAAGGAKARAVRQAVAEKEE